MSRWLGALPPGWGESRLDHVARAWTSNVDKHSVEGQPAVRLCNYTDVYKNASITGDLTFMAATATTEQVERFRLAFGDTVITKDSETADDIGIPAFVEYEAPDLVCGYHLAIVRPDSVAISPRFLYWVMASEPTLRQWEVLASGVTRVGIRSGDLAKAAIPLPPPPQQRAIADFLDRETARVDTLIAKQEQLIATLRERRLAVITHAATQGISGAALRSNSEAYLADLPQGWTVTRFSRAMSINGGQVDPREDPWAGMVLVAPNHIESGTGRMVGRETAHEQAADSGKYFASRGQILYSKIRPALNKVAIAAEDCLCSADMYAMSSSTGDDHHYLAYYMLARPFHEFATQASMRVKMPKINRQELGEAPWLQPPLEEQRAIVAYLDRQTATIDTVIARTQRFIELSKERRSALITAAVTGQIDVRGEVA